MASNKVAAGFSADFSNTTGPVQVSDGLHTATIERAGPGVSSNNNLKIDLMWTITDSTDEANVGRKVFDVLTFTEAAFYRVAQLIEACNLDTSGLAGKEVDSNFVKQVADMLLGETIVIETKLKRSPGINPATKEQWPERATVQRYHTYGFNPEAEQVTLLEGEEDNPFN